MVWGLKARYCLRLSGLGTLVTAVSKEIGPFQKPLVSIFRD